jgi:gamma-glutamyl:cysteine ligase YbdK (ATP-grasp superfamily)
MGQEITNSHFEPADFKAFSERLERETRLLCQWLEEGAFSEGANEGGFELEAWLVDNQGRPAPVIESYLQQLNDPLVVPELATFNMELNGNPRTLQGNALSALKDELEQTWGRCNRAAEQVGARLAMIGILPTADPADFSLANMSPLHRYHALNEQVFRMRDGKPLQLNISGRDRLHMEHNDVMLEAATTSFQIHLKVDVDQGGRFYNASKILSAPIVAVCANSPYLFGSDLWDETRIPLFEQSVAVGNSELNRRVTFGIRYIENSISEYFLANLERYPVLLPRLMDEPEERLAHVRLHNGTIWRWNRPLIGFDGDGRPHLRIEHRVVPAGPSILDSIANAAFYYGAVTFLATQEEPPESRFPFETVRDNFYQAARLGMRAPLFWLNGNSVDITELCLELLLPQAREGLLSLGVDPHEVSYWLGIIEQRVATGRTGAAWQRQWVERHGSDMGELTQAYLERQASGAPVHEWDL